VTTLRLAHSQLLGQFQEFYAEVIRLKRAAQLRTALAGSEREIWQRLVSLLERQAIDAERFGRAHASLYEQAQYVMAVLGDEIFVHLDWQGQEMWRANLLESRLFQTHEAGERFFDRLEELLRERDSVYVELAAVYLMALALGFRGRFFGVDDGGRLERYRRELFAFISGRDSDIASETRRLFPELQLHRLEEQRVHRLPDPRRWYLAVGGAVVAFLLIAHLLWYLSTSGIRVAVERALGG